MAENCTLKESEISRFFEESDEDVFIKSSPVKRSPPLTVEYEDSGPPSPVFRSSQEKLRWPLKGELSPITSEDSSACEEDPNGIVTVLNSKTNKDEKMYCIALKKKGSKKKKEDLSLYRKIATFSKPHCATGKIEIQPHSEMRKKCAEKSIIFWMLTGYLEITIHRTAETVCSGDSFYIPHGNSYILNNKSGNSAKVIYFKSKE